MRERKFRCNVGAHECVIPVNYDENQKEAYTRMGIPNNCMECDHYICGEGVTYKECYGTEVIE